VRVEGWPPSRGGPREPGDDSEGDAADLEGRRIDEEAHDQGSEASDHVLCEVSPERDPDVPVVPAVKRTAAIKARLRRRAIDDRRQPLKKLDS
jgi:hypothetical protein